MESQTELLKAEDHFDDSSIVERDSTAPPVLPNKMPGAVYFPMPREQVGMAIVLVFCVIGMAFYFWHRNVVENGLIDIDRAEPVKIQYLVDINQAPWPAIANLPGIGPKLAKEIVRHREQGGPFNQVEDIKEVRGIGDSKLEAIREYIASLPPNVVADARSTELN